MQIDPAELRQHAAAGRPAEPQHGAGVATDRSARRGRRAQPARSASGRAPRLLDQPPAARRDPQGDAGRPRAAASGPSGKAMPSRSASAARNGASVGVAPGRDLPDQRGRGAPAGGPRPAPSGSEPARRQQRAERRLPRRAGGLSHAAGALPGRRTPDRSPPPRSPRRASGYSACSVSPLRSRPPAIRASAIGCSSVGLKSAEVTWPSIGTGGGAAGSATICAPVRIGERPSRATRPTSAAVPARSAPAAPAPRARHSPCCGSPCGRGRDRRAWCGRRAPAPATWPFSIRSVPIASVP